MGRLLRIGIILLWVGLYGWHASRHLALDLGLTGRNGASDIIAAHQNRVYFYDLTNRDSEQADSLGTLQFDIGAVDTFFEVTTKVVIPELGELPGLGSLPLGTISGRAVVDATLNLDDRYRLVGLRASGAALGMSGSVEGVFNHEGFVGNGRWLNQRRRVHLPGIDIEGTTGFDLGVALPAGLAPGDSFMNRVLSPAMAPPYLSQSVVEYTVGPAQDRSTSGGTKLLMEVTILRRGQASGSLWVDDAGIIYESALSDTGLTLRLRKVEDRAGNPIWPAGETPP